MSKPIIEIENISKRYQIGVNRETYLSLRDEIAKKTRRLSSFFSRNKHQASSNETDFWALKDVSFSVQEGEAVGIIGRNGAGKSTLLKILSQITPPTKGKITMRDRVASLLEVGTGFHPELTGRENIFLNGAILGMTRQEIKRKFDEIVAFAETEKFLDAPVKRYSSGMYVRLAFAVAAHLEPEILIVDEVLSVGDAQFQKKCLGKMEDVAKEGRTVLFVSHNMAAVTKLCQLGIVLDKGYIKYRGTANDAVSAYRASTIDSETSDGFSIDRTKWKQSSRVLLHDVRLKTNTVDGSPRTGKSLMVELMVEALERLVEPGFAVDFRSEDDVVVFRASTLLSNSYNVTEIFGPTLVTLEIDNLMLASGYYNLDIRVTRPNIEKILEISNAAKMYVGRGDFYETGITISQADCLMVMNHRWTVGTNNNSLASRQI
jgi:lipopolysaccharide transport system ATP-binding protein